MYLVVSYRYSDVTTYDNSLLIELLRAYKNIYNFC